ncbi:Probable septum site-determining protein minC [hydrothermal vent metagenome]|uniref:Probable septum site-determining protein minC n=1 Tax=hydrothermal vent metagenome TaxID=652676 RepID=A0A1W1EKR0_9ZZZZ
MQSSQYSIKVFETQIEDDGKFISFIETNYELFKNHLIVIQGDISQNISEFLDGLNLTYINNINLPKAKKTQDNFIIIKEKIIDNNYRLKIINEPLRSGQIVEYEGDILITDRINSGAKLVSNGNIVALNIINGDIICNGDYIIMPQSSRSNILIQGYKINNLLLQHKLNKIEIIDSRVTITSISKKELKWV